MITFWLLCVLVILGHDQRIVHVAVGEHPAAAWTAQHLCHALPENDVPAYLVHDRDAVFPDIATTMAALNIQAVRTIAVTERLRGTHVRIEPNNAPIPPSS